MRYVVAHEFPGLHVEFLCLVCVRLLDAPSPSPTLFFFVFFFCWYFFYYPPLFRHCRHSRILPIRFLYTTLYMYVIEARVSIRRNIDLRYTTERASISVGTEKPHTRLSSRTLPTNTFIIFHLEVFVLSSPRYFTFLQANFRYLVKPSKICLSSPLPHPSLEEIRNEWINLLNLWSETRKQPNDLT